MQTETSKIYQKYQPGSSTTFIGSCKWMLHLNRMLGVCAGIHLWYSGASF